MVKDLKFMPELVELVREDDVGKLADLWTTVMRKRTPPFSNANEYSQRLAKEYRHLVVEACQSKRGHGKDKLALIYLVNQGFPVNFIQGDTTPLHACLDSGDVAAVRFLLRNNVDVEALDGNGRTPLFSMVSKGDVSMVRLLLARGASASVACGRRTPLEVCAAYGHRELCEVLLKHDARILPAGLDGGDEEGGSALHAAAREGHISILDLFSKHVDLDTPESTSLMRPLHEAAVRGQLAAVEFLLSRAFPVSSLSVDKDDRTPLHKVVAIPHDPATLPPKDEFIAIAAALIKSCPHLVFAQDAAGDTALHLSARNGYHKIAELLLSAGAECGAAGTEKTPPVNKLGRTAKQDCLAKDTGMVQLFAKYAPLTSAYLKLGETRSNLVPAMSPIPARGKLLVKSSTSTGIDKNPAFNDRIHVMPSAPPMEFQPKTKRMAPVIVN